MLLIASLLADGFLPDFQAEIKTVYKPQPMEMMAVINKWVTFISIIYSLLLWELLDICIFIVSHHLFLIHMLVMGVLSAVGQMFVYRMIKQFKQHFVPFVITTRKIFTVALSIVFYHHETNIGQVFGLILVFGVVTFEFVSELMNEQPPPAAAPVETSTDISRGTDLNLEQESRSSVEKMEKEPENSMSDEV